MKKIKYIVLFIMFINIYYLLKKHYYYDSFRYFIWYLLYNLDIFLMFIEEPFFINKKIEKPVFIYGFPRSATTALHETLYKASNISSITLGDILFKSYISKQLLKINFIRNHITKLLSKYKTDGHKISLESLSEEHLLLFNHFIYFAIPNLHLVLNNFQKKKQKEISLNDISFIKRVIQRLDDKRYVGKLLFLDGNYEILHEVFPDMVNIYCKRCLKDSFKSYIILGYNLSKRQLNFDEDTFEKFINNHHNMENNLLDIEQKDKFNYIINFSDWCRDQKSTIIKCTKTINLDIKNDFDVYRDGKSEELPYIYNKILDDQIKILFETK